MKTMTVSPQKVTRNDAGTSFRLPHSGLHLPKGTMVAVSGIDYVHYDNPLS
jgi:hypothetical protein